MMQKRVQGWQVALLGAFAWLAGCEGAPARSKQWRHEPKPADIVAPTAAVSARQIEANVRAAQRRKSLSIWLDREPADLNPLARADVAALRVYDDTIFESLFRYEVDAKTGEAHYAAWLAASHQVMPSGREIRLQLRPDVSFHDGKVLSARDVQFSIQSARGRAQRSGLENGDPMARLLRDVGRVEVFGDSEVRVKLTRPNGYVLRALAELPIVPAHIYRGDLSLARRAPVGTGPYRFASWKAGESILLTRNRSYWGPRPAIERVVFTIENDAAEALVKAWRGDIDFIPELIAPHRTPAITSAGQFSPVRLRPASFRYIVVNTTHPPFDDARLRRALLMAIDREGLARKMRTTRTVASPIWPAGPGDAKSPRGVPYDRKAAVALIEDCGWTTDKATGIRVRDGKRLHVELLVTAEENPDAESDAIRTALHDLRFAVTASAGQPAVLMNRLRAHQFDVALLEWRGHVDDDIAALVEKGSPLNFGQFQSPTVDAITAALRTVWYPHERKTKLEHLGEVMAQEMAVIPLSAPNPLGLIHRRVQGLRVSGGWISIRELALDRKL